MISGASRPSGAVAALAIVYGLPSPPLRIRPRPVQSTWCWHATRLGWANDVSGAVPIVTAALASAPPGNGGWLVPIEPLLGVRHARDIWTPALAALHVRAR